MRRRAFVETGIATGVGAALSWEGAGASAAPDARALTPPGNGPIDVAFLVSLHATMIDFTGPWEVFQDVTVPERGKEPVFRLYTVADTPDPVRVTGGMQIIPDYTLEAAPPPRVVVVPAMMASPAVIEWLKRTSRRADLIMSVCTGAFVVARAGLLQGKAATTHHQFYDRFAKEYPDVELRRGRRFVENDGIATAGGLTSGIDLALRVVERYFGRAVAQRTCDYMEHQSRAWIV